MIATMANIYYHDGNDGKNRRLLSIFNFKDNGEFLNDGARTADDVYNDPMRRNFIN